MKTLLYFAQHFLDVVKQDANCKVYEVGLKGIRENLGKLNNSVAAHKIEQRIADLKLDNCCYALRIQPNDPALRQVAVDRVEMLVVAIRREFREQMPDSAYVELN